MSQTSAKPVPKKQRDMNKKPSKSAVVIPAALLAILALAAFFLFALPSLRGDQANPQKLMQKSLRRRPEKAARVPARGAAGIL